MNTLRHISAGLVLASFVVSTAFASDVYIDQIGDSTSVTVTQSGGTGNTLGSSSTAASISGDSNTVSVTQDGSSNTADIQINGGSTTVTTSDTGSSNTTNLNIDGGTGTTTTSTVAGDSNIIQNCKTVDALGGCSAGITVNDTTQTIDVTGDSNTVDIEVDSANATIDLDVTGGTNAIELSQTGVAGVAGHSIALDHTGSNGTLSITQSGANDQAATVTTNGASTTLTITQGD